MDCQTTWSLTATPCGSAFGVSFAARRIPGTPCLVSCSQVWCPRNSSGVKVAVFDSANISESYPNPGRRAAKGDPWLLGVSAPDVRRS